MKSFKLFGIALLMAVMAEVYPSASLGQTTGNILVITTHKLSFPMDGRRTELDSLVTEWWQKVGSKVTHCVSAKVAVHYYSDDSRDWVEMIEYKSLADIEAADKEIDELEKKVWPDKAQARSFFMKIRKYYTGQHSDQIFRILPALGKQ